MRVIYVDVDSLRPDHTEPYGYRRKITPNLGEFAGEAVVFDRYYCSDSPCVPSRAAFSSGQFGITNGVIGHHGRSARLRFPDENVHPEDRPLLGGHLLQARHLHRLGLLLRRKAPGLLVFGELPRSLQTDTLLGKRRGRRGCQRDSHILATAECPQGQLVLAH